MGSPRQHLNPLHSRVLADLESVAEAEIARQRRERRWGAGVQGPGLADQNDQDFQAFEDAVKSGRLEATEGV